MPDIDSLSVNIKSSSTTAVKAIDDVIKALGNLNYAFNNYSNDSIYLSGLNNLTKGFNDLASSVRSIDLVKLKDLSKTLDTLSKSGEKMANLNFVKSFAKMGSEVQKVNSEISSKAQELANQFHIPEEEMGNLTNSVKKLYSAVSGREFKAAGSDIEILVRKYAKLEDASKELAEANKATNQSIKANTAYLSDNVMANWGDSAKANRGVLGIGNTTRDINAGADITALANEYGIYAESEYEAAQKMKEFGENASDAKNQINAANEAAAKWSNTLDELKQELGIVEDAVEDLDNEFATLSGPNPLDDDFEDSADKIIEATHNIEGAVENLQTEMNVEIGNPFQGVVNGLNALNEINIPADKFVGITSLASSFSKFSGKNAQTALTNIPAIGRAFAQMMAELAKAPQISNNVVRLAEALSQFSRSGREASAEANNFTSSVQGVAEGVLRELPSVISGVFPSFKKGNSVIGSLIGNLGRLFTSTKRTRLGFTSLAAVFGRLYANFFLLIRGVRLLGRAMSYSSQLTEVQNVVATTFGQMADKMEEFSQNAIQSFGLSELAAKQFGSRFQAMGSAMGITSKEVVKANEFITSALVGQKREVEGLTDSYAELGDSLADMSINLTKLTSDYASFYDQDFEDVATDMQAIFTGMTRPLRKYGLDLTQATLKEFALANGLDADIDKMTQAEKTLLRYQYVMSRSGKVMNDFAITANTFANVIRVIQQQFVKLGSVIGTALVNTFKPLLIGFRDFMNTFLGLVEKALNALGKLLGWQISLEKVGITMDDDMEDYADALDDAAGSAKKLKGQLRGIDELNNLTSNNPGGGSGGGAGGGGLNLLDDGGLKFLETYKDYESTVKGWYDFGKRIATAFEQGMLAIPWDSIYEKFGKFGNALANFLNGLIQPGTFKLAGKTLMDAFNAIEKAVFEFVDTFNFKKFGVSLANFINGFFGDWNPDDWSRDIGKIFGGILDAIDGFFNGMEGQFGHHIDGLDISGIHEKIKKFIVGVAEAIRTELNDINWDNVFEVAGGLGKNLADLLNSVITPENFATIGHTLINVFNTIFASLKDFSGEFNFKEFGASIGALITKMFEDWNASDWADTLDNFVDGFWDMLSGLFSGSNGEGGFDKQKISDKFKEFFTALDWKTIATAIGAVITFVVFPIIGKVIVSCLKTIWNAVIIPALSTLIATIAPTIGPIIGTALLALVGLVRGFLGIIKQAFKLSDIISQDDFWVIDEIRAELEEVFEGWFDDLGIDKFILFIEGIGDDLKNLPEIVKEMKSEWDEAWQGLFDDIGLDKLILWFEDLDSTLGGIDWTDFASGAMAFLIPLTAIADPMNASGISNLATEFLNLSDDTNIFGDAITKVAENFSTFKENTAETIKKWWEDDIQPIFDIEVWKEMVSSIKKSIENVWKETSDWWKTNIKSWWDEHVAPWFTEQTWLDALSGIKTAFQKIWGDATSFAKGFLNTMADFFENFINGVIDGLGVLASAKNLFSDSPINFDIPHIKIPRFAAGGYPQVGSLFWAGEAGAEMVGSVNGKTAVASNGEITGITQAIRSASDAELEMLRQQNALLEGILQKEFGISKEALFKSVKLSANEFTKSTGKPAFS